MPTPLSDGYGRSTGLVDVLDRVLDKGLVIAGDVKVSLAEVELLTIRIRLLICSIDKAEQIGMNWWRHDPRLSTPETKAALNPHAATAATESSKQESTHGS
jgi:hypothetical protein